MHALARFGAVTHLAIVAALAACTSGSSEGPFALDGGADGAPGHGNPPPPTTTQDGGPPPTTGKDAATTPPTTTSSSTYGDVHNGQYDLGPVEFHGSFNNSCSPYTAAIEEAEGAYLAGLDSKYNGDGHLCDACVLVTTAKGKSLVLRVVTTGQASGPENMDISKKAFDLLSTGEFPRTMKWQLAKCPDTGKMMYQFQTGAHVDWSSFWVRNARVPITKVEVKSARHANFAPLQRGGDGTLTDGGGFGAGAFTIRVTGMDGATVTDTFPSFKPGDVLTGGQFP